STNFVIMNTGSLPVAAPVVFYNQDGTTNTTYQQSLNVPAGGSVRFTLASSEAAVKVVWAKVLAGVGTVQGVATFDFRAANGQLISTAGVLGIESGNSFIFPVDVTDPSLNTGLAIANVTTSAVTVTLRFQREDGSSLPLLDARLQPLGPNRQT